MDAPAGWGVVVLVPFPFSDLSSAKLRPALILADAGLGDRICVQITSNFWSDHRAIRIDPDDFQSGSLDRISYARPGKLFTAHEGLFRRPVGRISDACCRKIADGVIDLLNNKGEGRYKT